MTNLATAVGVIIVASVIGCFTGIAAGAFYGPVKMLEMGIVNKYSNLIYKGGIIIIASIVGSLVGGCVGAMCGPAVVEKMGIKKSETKTDIDEI